MTPCTEAQAKKLVSTPCPACGDTTGAGRIYMIVPSHIRAVPIPMKEEAK